MATFFGEVLSVFSRAVEDEEDEDEVEEEEEDREIRRELEKRREVNVSWNAEISRAIEISSDYKLPCSCFILAVGDNATGFVSSYILSSGSWEVFGYVTLWNERCREFVRSINKSCAESSCTFYRSTTDPTMMLCKCICFVAEDQQFQWCEKVFSSLQKNNMKVTVLTSCPVSNYKMSTYNIPEPFLKMLKTKEYQEETPCSLMEQPNIVDGLPAAVLTYCQVWQIPAVLYQCYTDITELNSITMEAFAPILSCHRMTHLAADKKNIKEALERTVKNREIESNLYI
ncbi:proteasome assembly chaperone 1 [Bombina bombina]|uniref:proteasome assembly chaperone 1 n=1 Tax=Bombina bombina TaxID=8345 RepID=UPI00235B2F50|nr:proteasome assembly chaperone 1 [Bombina bombina]